MLAYAKILAPYLSIIVFWHWLENGWLALLGYHAQIVFWYARAEKLKIFGRIRYTWKIILPALSTGLIAYFCIPLLGTVSVTEWLANYQIEGKGFLVLIPYFSLLHPTLEQLHWQPLWAEKKRAAPFLFAGYHVLVLSSFFPWYLVLGAFVALSLVAVLWRWMYYKERVIIAPALVHTFADGGLITAAFFLR